MELKKIKEKLDPILKQQNNFIHEIFFDSDKKVPKGFDGKIIQVISMRLKNILGNPIENPIMRYDEADNFYFGDNGLKNAQQKYNEIIELQDYIIEQTNLPFIFDKYIILKILQVTLNTYNIFIEDSMNELSSRNEDVRNIFIDLNTMLMSDRNVSAENGTNNAKAVDTINRYKQVSGGYGVVQE